MSPVKGSNAPIVNIVFTDAESVLLLISWPLTSREITITAISSINPDLDQMLSEFLMNSSSTI
jgi:hypothetical protein